jgi:hypothetical protein
MDAHEGTGFVTSTQVAVECLMLWLEQDHERTVNHVRSMTDGPNGADSIIYGLMTVSALLLARLTAAEGAVRENWVQRGQEILAGLVMDET